MKESENRRRSDSGWASGMGTVAEYSVIGFVFPLALAIGFFLGRWIGTLLGGPLIGAVVGVVLGTAAGFYNLWETMRRLEQRERRSREEDGGDPPGGRPNDRPDRPDRGGGR